VAEVEEARSSSMAASLRDSVGRLGRTDVGLPLPLPPPIVTKEQGRRGGAEGPRERRRRRGPRAQVLAATRAQRPWQLELGPRACGDGRRQSSPPWPPSTPDVLLLSLPFVLGGRAARDGACPRRRMRVAELARSHQARRHRCRDGLTTGVKLAVEAGGAPTRATCNGSPRASLPHEPWRPTTSPPLLLVLHLPLLLVLRPLQRRPTRSPSLPATAGLAVAHVRGGGQLEEAASSGEGDGHGSAATGEELLP
jgi:hypothetical protein